MNSLTIKNFAKTYSKLAAGAAFAALAFAAPTGSASAAATLAQNFYQESGLKNCPNAATCTVLFSAIPAGKTVIIQNVGCTMQVSGSLPLLSATLSSKLNGNSTQRSNYLIPTLMGTANSLRNFNINAATIDIMNPAEIPQIFLSLSGTATTFVANCSISGRYFP